MIKNHDIIYIYTGFIHVYYVQQFFVSDRDYDFQNPFWGFPLVSGDPMADQTGQDDLFLAEPSREGPLKSGAEMGDCAWCRLETMMIINHY